MYVGVYKNLNFINESFYNMHCLVMFIAVVCLLFSLKLKWPMNKSIFVSLMEVRTPVGLPFFPAFPLLKSILPVFLLTLSRVKLFVFFNRNKQILLTKEILNL